MSVRLAPLPNEPGAYRWYYFDVSAPGMTVVAIFMLGSPFSPRYVPQASCAMATGFASVNLAVYRGDKRVAWVFSEFDRAELTQDRLRIGGSTVSWTWTQCEVNVDERSVLFGRRVQARLTFDATASLLAPFPLTPDGLHTWEPIVPRARARWHFEGEEGSGLVYHDSNAGSVPLGESLKGWSWSRTHTAHATLIRYAVGDRLLQVRADEERVISSWRASLATRSVRTGWGLELPHDVDGAAPRILESSPFYARYEVTEDERGTLGEVARFEALRRPMNRWMARTRLRVESAP